MCTSNRCHISFLGLPRGRGVRSIPRFFAVVLIQSSDPNGRPVLTDCANRLQFLFGFRRENPAPPTAATLGRVLPSCSHSGNASSRGSASPSPCCR